jgi:IS5 family transposase
MYRHNEKQFQFEDFKLPFAGKLRSDNRWVKLAKQIPWEEIEDLYASSLCGSGKGAPALSVRIAFGAMVIKEKLGLSDEETVEQIRENPYLQYFLGLKQYEDKAVFHPTMFVHFRKRFPEDIMNRINELIAMKAIAATSEKSEKDSENDDNDSSESKPRNKGKLLVDATCAPEDINYPTDLKLLNKGREQSEQIIDTLHEAMPKGTKKPRTYRQNARKDFLKVAKSRKVRQKALRKGLRKQLGYLRRNLKSIEKQCQTIGLSVLSRRQYKTVLVISELYRQQKWMYDHKSHRIDDRIVSINKPHVRPIKRGKAGADTEFGAKISASVVDGFTFIDRISWNNFNESTELIDQIEAYKDRFGFYPESVHADKIYRNRENLRYCKKYGIRVSGPKLGRPPKQTEQNKAKIAAEKKLAHQDEIDRIAIEGKFGLAKRHYSLGRIMTKLDHSSKTAIIISFLVMNLERWLQAIFLSLFWLLRSLRWTLFSRGPCTHTDKITVPSAFQPAFVGISETS